MQTCMAEVAMVTACRDSDTMRLNTTSLENSCLALRSCCSRTDLTCTVSEITHGLQTQHSCQSKCKCKYFVYDRFNELVQAVVLQTFFLGTAGVRCHLSKVVSQLINSEFECGNVKPLFLSLEIIQSLGFEICVDAHWNNTDGSSF